MRQTSRWYPRPLLVEHSAKILHDVQHERPACSGRLPLQPVSQHVDGRMIRYGSLERASVEIDDPIDLDSFLAIDGALGHPIRSTAALRNDFGREQQMSDVLESGGVPAAVRWNHEQIG